MEKPLRRNNYGSIPHLLGSKLGDTDKYVHEGQHKIMTEKTRDSHDMVIVTEKYDGSNVGIAKVNGRIIPLTRSGYLADTSPYVQHHFFAKWVYQQKDRFDFIGEGERITGEWVMQTHSIRYKILYEPFVAFDYFDYSNNRLTYDDFFDRMNNDILIPNLVFCGNKAFPIQNALTWVNNNRCEAITAIDKPEGVVYRVERKGIFDFAAKFVRPDFECGKYIINVEEKDFKWNIRPEELKLPQINL